jgi:hypothetical protein
MTRDYPSHFDDYYGDGDADAFARSIFHESLELRLFRAKFFDWQAFSIVLHDLKEN